MEKLVKIENKEIGLKVSAGTVRSYRNMFGRDLILDMASIEKNIIEAKSLESESAGIAEQIVWLMAREYDPEIPDLEEWLDQFSPYFIYSAINKALEMWVENMKQLNHSKKK